VIGNTNKRSLTSEEVVKIAQSAQDYTAISDLLVGASKSVGATTSYYLHLPAIGATDFKSSGVFHGYNSPQSILDYYRNKTGADPIITSGLKAGKVTWLSDTVNYPAIAGTRDEKRVYSGIELVGDGICCPLYGPQNRRGFAFVGFGRDKSEFDPILPLQMQALLQIMHIRYCELVRALNLQIKVTPREAEVLELICYGKTSSEIGDILGISSRTVDGHTSKVYTKLGTSDRVSTALRAQTINIQS